MRTLHAALIATVIAAVGAGAPRCEAQAASSSASDAVFRRAQRLVNEGSGAAGRALVDSVLAASPDASPQYVEALYWRASLAESADQARRAYLRIVVEFSLSARAEDALLRLSQLELARGDRDAAKKYLNRLAIEHPTGASRPLRAYWLGRVLLEEGAMVQACASLAEARESMVPTDVELANQITYYTRPCAAVQRAADSVRADSVAKADSTARADAVARADSVARAQRTAKAVKVGRAVKAGNATTRPLWSAQVAAYNARTEADRMAKYLGARGYEARVTAGKPYRVRVGRYVKWDDAAGLVRKLKTLGMAAIIVEAETP